MISAIAQAVANILASGPSLTSTEQIDFGYPGRLADLAKPCLNLYHYEIQVAHPPEAVPQIQIPSSRWDEPPLRWFDLLFALMARDHTVLGEQRMLTESLTLLLQHPHIPTQFLSPSLRAYETLPLSVAPMTLLAQPTFWTAIGIPLRPALQITVTAPFTVPLPEQAPRPDRPLPHAPP